MAHSHGDSGSGNSLGGLGGFLRSAGGAATITGLGGLLSGLGGLIGGQSPLERLQLQLLQQQFDQRGTRFGQAQGLFRQGSALFGQPLISNSRFNSLFNQANQGEIARIGSSLQQTGIGNSSPLAASTFAFGTGGARARGMFGLIGQQAQRDVGLFGGLGSLTRG